MPVIVIKSVYHRQIFVNQYLTYLHLTRDDLTCTTDPRSLRERSWMRLRSTETLRALMRQQRLSLGGLAAAAHCSKSFISHLLSGRRNTCSDALAERIAAALDVPTRVIFVPSKSITDRQLGHRSLPPAAPETTKSGYRTHEPGNSPAPRPTGPDHPGQPTGQHRRLTSRCGWEPQGVLLGNRGKAVGRASRSLHRRPVGARAGSGAAATSRSTEVSSPCNFAAATR